MYRHTAPNQRPYRPDPVVHLRNFSPEISDLGNLVKEHSWRTLTLASRSVIVRTPLSQYKQILEVWVYRCLSLIRLEYFELASREMERLEQMSKHPIRDVEADGDTNTMIHHPMRTWPWELRVMRCQIPALVATSTKYTGGALGRHSLICRSIDRTHALIRSLNKKIRSSNPESNSLYSMYQIRHFQMVLLLSRQLLYLKDIPQAIQAIRDYVNDVETNPYILSALARIHLQFGDVEKATELVQSVEKLLPNGGDSDDLAIMNRAFLSVAQNKWLDAREEFTKVEQHRPTDFNIVNNIALCDLYEGNLGAALDRLDELLLVSTSPLPQDEERARQMGTAQTSETILYNYCSCLELQLDGQRLQQSKSRLLAQVAAVVGDGFDARSLKIDI